LVTETDLGFTHRFVRGEGPITLLLLHGTGADENDLLPLGRAILSEAHMLSPRGKVLENGMPRFFRRFSEGVFDVEDLVARTHELADFVDRAAKEYDVDPGHIVAVGFSNGANIAASLLLLHPGLLAGAVLLRAMLPFEPDEPPDLTGTRVLISAGRRDQMTDAAMTERLEELLRSSGAEVELRWQDAGHELTQDDIAYAGRWLTEPGLGGSEAPE
jgi:phospholipase/carboxylesterase